ncbi:MAG: hypothetical protein RIQ59_122, partial [Bacteroidota bacterium]
CVFYLKMQMVSIHPRMFSFIKENKNIVELYVK